MHLFKNHDVLAQNRALVMHWVCLAGTDPAGLLSDPMKMPLSINALVHAKDFIRFNPIFQGRTATCSLYSMAVETARY